MKAVVVATALVLLGTAPTAAAPARGSVEFEVTRNGQPFGRHVITFTGAGDELRSESLVSLRAGVGPLTVFRYEQACAETWAGARLATIECSTLRDGRRLEIRGNARDGRLVVTGANGVQTLSAAILPTSWWRRPTSAVTNMLDTETGSPMPVRVTEHGWEPIIIDGHEVRAERVRVQGAIGVDLWYDERGAWVGCRFVARGQLIEYRLSRRE